MLGKLEGNNETGTYLRELNYLWNEKKYKDKKSNGLLNMIIKANLCMNIFLIF